MKLPSAYDVSGPASLRPAGTPVLEDTSGLGAGVRNLATGLQQAAGSIVNIAQREKSQEDAVDLARAEAQKTAKFLDIQNQFAQDGDYATFHQRAEPLTTTALEEAGGLIRDERLRERWLADQESARITMLDAIDDHGRALKMEAEKVAYSTALDQNAKLVVDPMVPEEVRRKAKSDIEATIMVGEQNGLLSPADAKQWRDVYVEQVEQQLALNRAELDIRIDPQRALIGLAIPTDGTGVGLVAQTLTIDGKPVMMDMSLAQMTADVIGDANFPDDPKLAKEYLSDPEVAQQYVEAATAMLADRYKGDMTAVVIAADPNGGTTLADQWVASGHDESVLPADVRKRYKEVMARGQPVGARADLPIAVAPGIDIGQINGDVLDRWGQVQNAFGVPVQIISGYRDQARNARAGGAPKSQHLDHNAIDIDVSKLSKDERVRLIETASAMGFTGIGVYDNSLHLDMGERRSWGPTHKAASVPGWAKKAVDAHLAGTAVATPGNYNGVDPDYAALTFDQRLSLSDKARNELKERNVGMKASLQTITENAPVAIAQTGRYDGRMPDAADFVATFGGSDGIQRYKEFQANVEVAQSVFGMRTMSTDDIINLVKASTPTSSGNDAALQAKRYEMVTAAADRTFKARNADPAGYTLEVFPRVAAAFDAADKAPDPETKQKYFQAAIASMAEAQKTLGLDSLELLPKAMADNVANAFKDTEQPAELRMGAVAQTVFQTNDEDQQKAIFDQLVKSGVDPQASMVLDAISRGDGAGAAMMTRALLVDPDKMKVTLPYSDAQIKERSTDRVFSEGEVGDIMYGISDGSTDNFDRMQADAALFDKMVKLRLIDGSAGGNVETAIDMTKKDMWGDLQTLTGNGSGFMRGGGVTLKVTVPKDTDAAAARVGFNSVLPDVRASLFTSMMGSTATIPAETGALAIAKAGVQNYVDRVISEGQFVNAGGEGKYQFLDPFTGSVVAGPTGAPLTFTLSQIMTAAQNNRASAMNVWQKAATEHQSQDW